jgi:hypothetical protein
MEPSMRIKKLALLLCLGLVFLLAACNEYSPNSRYDTPLINEVYTNSASNQLQWVEIYNNSPVTADAMDLTDWTLNSGHGSVKLSGTLDATHKYLVVTNNLDAFKAAYPAFKDPTNPKSKLLFSGALANLDPKTDVLVLKKGDGSVADQVGWGNPSDDLKNKVGTTGDVDLNLNNPADPAKSFGRTPPGTPADGVPTANPGHFTLHDSVSPGGTVVPDATKYTFPLATGTDILTGIGGIALWLAFIMVAFIARRFEVLAEQKTYWKWLLGAPIGIFLYDIILMVAYTVNHGSLENWEKWLSFPLLFLSGIFCLWVINIFRLIAKNILEAE